MRPVVRGGREGLAARGSRLTPHRVSAHGSYRIDLRFPGVGRIALASGAKTLAELEKRRAMLRELYDKGQWEVLTDLQAGRFSLARLYVAHQQKKVGDLSVEIVLQQSLATAVDAWLPTSARAKATRTRYGVSWRSLSRAGVLTPTAAVRALEHLDWRALQKTWAGGPYDWRHLRGFVSAFLSSILKDQFHPFRRRVLEAFPAGPTPEGRVPDLTPAVFWQMVEAMPAHTRAAPVVILLTGMRVGELVACQDTDLQPLTHSVRIPGQQLDSGEHKSDEATQPVDPSMWRWVTKAIPFGFSEWTLRDHWRAVRDQFHVRATLHDLRHCLGQWLVNEGQTEESVQRSLRHKTPAMTRRYVTQRDRQANARAIAEVLARSHSKSHSGAARKKQKGR